MPYSLDCPTTRHEIDGVTVFVSCDARVASNPTWASLDSWSFELMPFTIGAAGMSRDRAAEMAMEPLRKRANSVVFALFGTGEASAVEAVEVPDEFEAAFASWWERQTLGDLHALMGNNLRVRLPLASLPGWETTR